MAHPININEHPLRNVANTLNIVAIPIYYDVVLLKHCIDLVYFDATTQICTKELLKSQVHPSFRFVGARFLRP